MLLRRDICFKVVLGALLAQAAVGCGPEEPQVVKANVVAGEMPAEASWRGVYYDQTYGFLHITATGSSASGKWRTAGGEKWGELHGTIDGDLLKYKWDEHKIGMFGPNATTSGHGYFKYIDPGDNADHEIHGEWGLDENEAGNPWNAIKQRNMEPDPDSVMPDETQTSVKGGDWDSSNSDAASGPKAKEKQEDAWE